MIEVICDLNLNGLVEKERSNIHRNLRFNFLLALFYSMNYLLCCLYLYFSSDEITKVSLLAVFLLGGIILFLLIRTLIFHRAYKASADYEFKSVREIEDFFNTSYEDDKNLLCCRLYGLSDDIKVSESDNSFVISFRRLNGTKYGVVVELQKSDLKRKSMRGKQRRLILRGTESVLVN